MNVTQTNLLLSLSALLELLFNPLIFANDSGRKKRSAKADPPSLPSSDGRKDSRTNDAHEEELARFSEEIRKLSANELDRDIAEMKSDIEFQESQIRFDLGSFTPGSLEKAKTKIQLLKRKVEILEKEYSKRTPKL